MDSEEFKRSVENAMDEIGKRYGLVPVPERVSLARGDGVNVSRRCSSDASRTTGGGRRVAGRSGDASFPDLNDAAAAAPAPLERSSVVTDLRKNSGPVQPVAVTLPEAAQMLSVHEDTIRREIDRGRIRGMKIGRVWRVRVAELNAYMKRLETEAQR